ncbi:TlpA family protein disulfide reductase [Bacillus sp. EB106-08-02-XG196]|jgi:peroxiredoxin|uniref:TlpA disulfide reductase family protein n=1 Tax=Bacillus sp. EB106-08-02-XG196 TaxID=2737049 RepID=UPI0015C479A1|nr:TlpA disulfide reductase family protein [Bacillus sp. EB106-08-02-XG196]NWQ40275.1 TlpA family protein disulfide reductase [Bacillus sp. EB106-08-02-XG196]
MMKWLVLGIAVVIGFVFLKLWLLQSQKKEPGKQLFDLVFNSIFCGFLIWKGSQLLLEPKLMIESPLSLLYFTGGTKGLILGTLGALIYLIFKARKLEITNLMVLQSTLVFAFAVMSGSFLLNLFLNEDKPKVNTVSTKTVEIGLQEGNKAPDFQLKTLDDADVKLSDLRGKKVILNFWATWCPPCKAEIPHMRNFYVSSDKSKVEILAINLTTSEKNPKNVKGFVKDRNVTFPVLLDQDGDVGVQYQAITIPTSYLIDSQGIVRKKIVGPMDKDMMNQLIENVD